MTPCAAITAFGRFQQEECPTKHHASYLLVRPGSGDSRTSRPEEQARNVVRSRQGLVPPMGAAKAALIVKRAGAKNGAQRPRESQKIHRGAPRVRAAPPRGRWHVKIGVAFDIYCHYSGENSAAARHDEFRGKRQQVREKFQQVRDLLRRAPDLFCRGACPAFRRRAVTFFNTRRTFAGAGKRRFFTAFVQTKVKTKEIRLNLPKNYR